MRIRYDNQYLNATVTIAPNRKVIIEGTIRSPVERMEVFAAHPLDRMMNYSGSGLPFPCASIAFCNTPNFAIIPPNGQFSATFMYPNSYYSQDATTKIKPSIFVILQDQNGADPTFVRLQLPDELPLRTLTHRSSRVGPEFYSKKADIIEPGTAEATMRTLAEAKSVFGIA